MWEGLAPWAHNSLLLSPRAKLEEKRKKEEEKRLREEEKRLREEEKVSLTAHLVVLGSGSLPETAYSLISHLSYSVRTASLLDESLIGQGQYCLPRMPWVSARLVSSPP